jgi:hypothetical protein
MAERKKRIVTDEHKGAMAMGRNQSRLIGRYLEALDAHKPKRGRKRTTDTIDRRLAAIDDEMESARSLQRLNLIQERRDLMAERETLGGNLPDISELEDEFVSTAKGYGERKGISYATWRELGVPSAVLKKAGISRGQ